MVRSNAQKGATILQAIVGAVLLTITIVVALRSTSVLSRKIASDTRLAAVGVEKGLAGAIALRIDALAKSTCGGGAVANAANTLAAIGTLTIPGVGTATPSLAISYTAGVDATADAAVARCRNPVSPTTNAVEGGYYICFQLRKLAGAVLGSTDLFNTDEAFIEARANLINLNQLSAGDRGPYPSCAAYQASAQAGIALYYRIYWNRRTTDGRSNFVYNGKSVFAKP